MNILILGGTGAIGSYVSNILKNKGYCIYVTSRKKQENKDNVVYIQGNAKELNFLGKLCEKHWDVIIDFMVYTLSELTERIDILLNSTNQYVFISSARVYADNSIITEDSTRLLDICQDKEYVTSDEYAIVKAKQENLLLKGKRRNWTIIRPSLTYSEYRLQLGVYEKENWLYRALHGRSIVFSEDLMDKYYTMSYGKDVAEGIANLIGRNDSLGEIFNIVINKAYQWKDILNIYLNVLEEKTNQKPNVILTKKCTNLDLPYAKYQVLYGRYYNRHFDNKKIDKIINTSEWLLPEEGLKKCLNLFLENPIFLNIDWHKEALIDRAAKEWTPLSEIPGIRNKIKYLKWRLVG